MKPAAATSKSLSCHVTRVVKKLRPHAQYITGPRRQGSKLPHWRPIFEQPIHEVQRQARHEGGLEKRRPLSSRNQ